MLKISLRTKLLLLSVAMLSIPYVGFQYLRETERYLQSSLEDSLLAVSGALAVTMQGAAKIFHSQIDEGNQAYPIFVHSLSYPIHVDGYIDDWAGYMQWIDRFDLSSDQAQSSRAPLSFELIVGEHDQYLNLLVRVTDESYVYQDPGSFAPDQADTVEIVVNGESGRPQRIFLSSAGPGPVTAYNITENWDFSLTREPITNVVGEWRETDNGFVVEIRLPIFLVGAGIAIIVHDKDRGLAHSQRVSSAVGVKDVTPNELIRTSAQLQNILRRVGLKKGRRVWVINRNGQVLASDGTLVSESKRGAINFLYTWILPRATGKFIDDLQSASRLRTEEVLSALKGQSATRWRSSPDERAVIVSAAHPVWIADELVGAVVVEETTNSIQTVQRDAMAGLFNKSIAVFVGVTFILLAFASRLSMRIRKLRDQSEQAIDPHGRVIGVVSRSHASDEIGDLSRSFAAMLERLRDYNAYLESMASKLSHELRTPLTVVSSSLENLDEAASLPKESERFLARAREGMARLHSLVSRLSEASRLEQSVANVEFEAFDLSSLLRGCVEGYRSAYPAYQFNLDGAEQECLFQGSGDLIAQLLDKLIANAVAFSPREEAVEIALLQRGENVELRITNRGSSLPQAMQKQIFNSMVSVREEHASEEPHLGLGLFVARLIVELHGGDISAENLADLRGVCFKLVMPRDAAPPVRVQSHE